ncbi:uncharacterized protein RCO7_11630 [Rhynchosporium graminicola]|uniref:Mid2 domain-containing protein n=1 Tax=Rhynchosporium graminicola TaxID=2792576 RepID=A0A1E1LJN0_9HELO|nr:uncharacterized protein RCO7_11630 [Rhynchosporium commune]
MLSRPQLRLCSVVALLVAITNASWLDANINGRGYGLDARQQVSGSSSEGGLISGGGGGGGGGGGNGGASITTTSSSTSLESPSTPTPTPTPSSSPSPPPAPIVVASPTTTPPSIPTLATTISSPASPPSSASSTPSQTSTTSSSTTTKTIKTTPKVTPTPTTFVVVSTIVRTESGSTFMSLASATVTSDLPTSTAELNKDGKPTSDTGMSTKTRSTIIGVVVGIGGAIILAGLGFVAYRIWGRRKNADENDGLMFGNTGHEKTGSLSAAGATNASPFTSTLEDYHNPARNGNVNASSNF